MPLTSGTRLGPYEIGAQLGAGGMGEVYRAQDTRLNRTVAIKVLSEHQGAPDRSRLDRFQQEARAVARINHPGICSLYDVGQDGATTFLVMEHVAGETLAARLESGAMPVPAALRTATQIADALDHAHRQGVTHRDLKPSNLMLTRDGVKILDFGLAKLREDVRPDTETATALQLTESGTVVGTLPYMSPKQLEGRQVDARSDIFSFGVVLYEMVTGRRPFGGDSRVSLMAAIVSSEPRSASAIQPLVPAGLDRLIARCLAKDPDDRWQDARDLAAHLRWLAAPESGVSPAAPAISPFRTSRRALLVAGLVGAALGGAAIAPMLMLRSDHTTLPTFAPVTFQRGIVTAARFGPDAQTIVYSGSWQGAPHDVLIGRERSSDTRSLQVARGRILSVSKSGDLAVHVGPQVVTPQPGMLASMPLTGGARRELLESVTDADWIPGTGELAVVRAAETGMSIEFPIGHKVRDAPAIWSLRVSPDGTRAAFFEGTAIFSGRTDATVVVIDRSGKAQTLARDITGLGLAWAPSGREVWFTASTGTSAPSLYGASLSGDVRGIYHAPDWLVLHDISPDGRVLMSRNSVRISMTCQGVGDSAERDLTWLIASNVASLARDGRSVVFAEVLGSEGGVQQVYRRPLDGAPAVALGAGTPLAMSPNGAWVVVRVNGALSLVPTGAGAATSLSKGSLTAVFEAGWLDDATVVFTGSDKGGSGEPRIYVQSVSAGQPRAITPEGVSLAGRAPTPDGRTILGVSHDVWQLYPLAGGDPRSVPGLGPRDQPIQGAADGQAVYVGVRAGRSVMNVFRVDITSGRRSLWKALTPSDPVGVDAIQGIALTPDASAYCYSHLRRLGDLFVVTGLK